MALAITARSAIGRNTTPNIIGKSTKHGHNGIGQRLLHGQGTRSRQHRSQPPYDHRIKRLRVVKNRKSRKRPGRGSPTPPAHALVERLPRPKWQLGGASWSRWIPWSRACHSGIGSLTITMVYSRPCQPRLKTGEEVYHSGFSCPYGAEILAGPSRTI